MITVSDVKITESNSTFSPNAVFTVTLSAPLATDVLIDYQTVNGTATEEYDVDQTVGTLLIPAGQTSGTITITTFGGSEVELDESFVLELTNPRGDQFADGAVSLRAAGTLLDNDGAGSKLALFVDDVKVVEGDSGQREAVFLVRLSSDPVAPLTLDYQTTDGSAIAGLDYLARTGSLTFVPGGPLVQEVRVPVLGDGAVEVSESFSLTFAPTSAIMNGAAGASGTATILDDDAGDGTLPVLSLRAAEVMELDSTFSGNMEFVVTLSSPALTDVVVDYQTIGRTAAEEYDVDQTLLTGRLVIAAGETSGTIVITTFGLSELETDESFLLELTNVQGAVFEGDAPRLQAQGVILDNDGAGQKVALFVGDAELVEGNSGQREAVFEVRLSRPVNETVTVNYTTRDGSAVAGQDYQAAAGTVTFLPGETVKAVIVPVFGDAAVEGAQQFSLVLTPSGPIANGVAGAAGIGTILDDDAGNGALPVLSLLGAQITELDSTFSGNMEFVVRLSTPALTDVVVDYQTIGRSAAEQYDVDQTLLTGRLVIAAGETSGVITITTFGLSEVEADESFLLELTNVQGAVFAGDAPSLQAQGLILDNDGAGGKLALLVSDAQVMEGDGGQREAVFEVRLSRPVNEAVTINYTTSPGSASTGSDFAPVSGTLTFLPGQTLAAVHVPVFGDGATEAGEEFSLVLSAPQAEGSFGSGGAGAEGIATILDDDAGNGPVINVSRGHIVEGNGTFGANMEFVVTLSEPSATTVSVSYTTVNGTATAGSDYQTAAGTLTFVPGQTSAVISITTLGGAVAEPDEVFALRLSSPQNATLAGGVSTLDAIGAIVDNDSPDPLPINSLPILTVEDIEIQETNGGTLAVFELRLSKSSTIAISGSFTVTAGTATAGADFTPISGTFHIAPDNFATTVIVAIPDDALAESTETLVLRLDDIHNARLENFATHQFAIGRILDNDPFDNVPLTADDAIATNEDSVVITLTSGQTSVLANDADFDGDPLSVVAVQGVAGFVGQQIVLASGALLTLNADGTFAYDPNGKFENLAAGDLAHDTFEYTVADGHGGVSTAHAVIEVSGVTDAPSVPVVTVADVTVTESNSTFSPNAVFTVTLSHASTTDVLIDYQTVNGTATEEYDVDQLSGTLTILAGQTTGTITITAFGLSEVELDESFALELTNARGAVFAGGGPNLRAAGTLLDNDGAGSKLALFVDDVQVVEGDNGAREAVFLVRLSRDPGAPIVLGYQTTDGSAVAGQDYEARAGSLTFVPGGALVQEVRVPVLGELAVEGSETFSLTFAPTSAIMNGAAGASGTATILDDDAGDGTLPVLSLRAAEVMELDSTFSGNMEFVVTLSSPALTDVVVDYQTIGRTAAEEYDVDQTLLTGRLVIAAGETSGTIVITTFGLSEVETDESFLLELTNVQGAVFAGDAPRLQAQGVILENDGAGGKLALLVGDAEIAEGDGGQREAVFEVRLSRPVNEAVTVNYTTRDAGAVAGQDYQALSGTVTFLPGETVKAVAVPVFGDLTVEGTEQFSLVFTPSGPIANGAAGAAGIATILDDDAGSGTLPVLSLFGAQVAELDSTFSGNMEFVVRLSTPALTDVVVDYQTIGRTAAEQYDVDQTLLTGRLVIAAGETSGVITITTFGLSEVEADESFLLELTNVQGAVFAGDATRLQAQGVLLDNDGAGGKLALLVSDAQVVEGDGGQREAVFEVRLSRPVNEAVTVNYTTSPGSASTGPDFAPVQGTLTFLAGQTVAAVHVPVFGDTTVEASEQFSLVLSAPQGGGLFGYGDAGAEGMATILDDDAGDGSQPVISVSSGHIVELNSTFSGNMEFVVTLSAPTTDTVRVSYTTVNGTAVAGSDYQAATGTVTFAPGQTSAVVSIVTLGGAAEELDESFVLRLSSPQNASLAGGVAVLDAVGTIIDNDGPPRVGGLPFLSVADVEQQEVAGGTTATFTLNLSSPTAVAVSGTFTVVAGTATEGADFAPLSGIFRIEPDQTFTTITVFLADDGDTELPETFVLRLQDLHNAQFANFADSSPQLFAIGRILDNDPFDNVPLTADDAIATNEDSVVITLTSGQTSVLANDADFDGDPLSVVAVQGVAGFVGQQIVLASGALLTLNADGTFAYDPNGKFENLAAGDLAHDTFEYTVADGHGGVSTAHAVIEVSGVTDAPSVPVVTVADVTVTESNSTFSPNAVFTVTLSHASTTDVLIDYQTVNGTATEEYDVDQLSGTLTILAGQTTGTITITAFGLSEVELDESFALELTNARGAVFAGGGPNLRAAGTLLDNDGAGSKLALFVDDVQVVEGDNGAREAVFLVRLSRDPGAPIVLGYQTTDGSAVAGQDYEARAGSLTFVPGGALVQEVRVPVLGELAVEGSETFSLTFAPTSAIMNGAAGASGTATILDDDAGDGTLPVLSLRAAEVMELDSTFSGNMEFVVTLSSPALTDVVVDYQTIGRTAAEEYDVDQTLLTGRLVIAAGETSGTIVITTFGLSEVETDESFLLELTNVQGAVFAGDAPRLQAQGVILENDGAGGKLALLVGDAEIAEGDGGQREAVFEVRLSRPVNEAVTVNYTTRDAGAVAGQDYQALSGTVTFLPGETVKAVAVPVFGDLTVEGTEQFSLVFTPSGPIANGAAGAAGIATILDDDAGSGTLPVLSLFGAQVAELDSTFSGNMEFVVRLSTPALTDVVVDYQTIGRTAAEQYDVDQTLLTGRLVIAAGETSGVITITTFGLSEVEADESFLLELTNVQGAVFAGDATRLQAQGVLLDNDGAGGKLALLVSDAQVVEGDGGQREAVFEVRLSRPVNEAVTVNYTTSPGSASTGPDFAPVQGTLTFLAGQTVAAVHVPVFGDTTVEASEQFSLVLSAPQGTPFGAGGAGAHGAATILNDDAGDDTAPVISIMRGEVVETDGTFSGNMEFVVRLSAPSTEPVRVSYTTVNGTAVAGSDYQAATGTLTFAPGQTSAVISVAVLGGNVAEAEEAFILQLSSPQNASLAGGVATLDAVGTIVDDDGAAPAAGLPTLSVADIEVQETAGGTTALFTLNLSATPAGPVNGNFAVLEGTATGDSDFTPLSGTFHFDAGQTSVTVVVAVLDDDVIEPTETFVLHLTDLSGARFAGTDQELWAIGRITDDDSTPRVQMAPIGDASLIEGFAFSRVVGFSDGEDNGAAGWTYTIDFGDGSEIVIGTTSVNVFELNHVFADGTDTYTVTVTVTDVAGESSSTSFAANVLNVGPTVELAGADQAPEGSTYTLTLGGLVDPGTDTPTSFELSWGDGTVVVYTPAEFAALNGVATHVYADGAFAGLTQTIQLTVTDEDGTFTAGSKLVQVTNVAPTVVLDGAATTAEGAVYTLSLAGSDPAGVNDTLAYEIDWGDGSAVQTLSAAELAVAGGTVTHVYADDQDGPINTTAHTISVTVSDEDGGSSTSTHGVAVTNVVPTLALTGADTVAEGSPYALALGALVDPGTDTAAGYSLDWGDGTVATYTVAELAALNGTATHTYADGGLGGTPRTITLSVTDEDGTFTVGAKALTVTNVAPAVVLDGEATTAEGSVYTLALAGSDPAGANDTLSYAIDWGDGTAVQTVTAAQLAAAAGNVTHVFADDEDGPINATAHTISVTVSDEDGGSSTSTHGVTVTNVAPTIAVSGAAAATAGVAYVLSLGAVADPGTDTVTQYAVDWGDGSTPQAITAAQLAASGGNVTHTYAATGAFAISVALVDEDGTHAAAGTHAVTVDQAAPTVAVEAGPDASVNEGAIFTRTITFTDGEDNGAPGRSYAIDYGDGSAVQTGTTTGNTIDLSHLYADGAATHTVTVTVTDVAGESASDSFAITVSNVAPTLALTGADTVAEGSVYTLALGALVDPGADTASSYALDWGDGSVQTYTAAELAALGATATHTYADGGLGGTPRTITLSVTDEDGTFLAGTKSLTVTNVAPTVALDGAATTAEGSVYTLSLVGSDPAGVNDTLSYVIDWADGTGPQTVTAAQLALAGGTVTHVYADDEDGPVNATAHTISVTVSDEDGGSSTSTHGVTVTNVSPTVAVTGAAAATAGVAYVLSLGAVADPGTDTVTQYVVDWGDGSAPQTITAAELASAGGNVAHTYSAAGGFAIGVALIDEDGTHTEAGAHAVTVNDPTPTLVLEAGGNATVNEGDTFTRIVTFSDGEDNGAAGWTYSIDYGDGSAPATGTTTEQSLALSHQYLDGAATHTVTVTVTDVAGESATDSFAVTVSNVAPTVALDGADTTTEGSVYTLSLAGSDPAGANDTLSYVIDWGDGTAEQTVTAAQLAAVNGNVAHVFADDEDGPNNATALTISVTVSDEDGGSSTSTQGVTVTNVAPTVAVTGAAAATAGSAYVLSLGAVADPGTDTVTQYVVDWGDGSAAQTITATELASAGGNVTHTYSATGGFAISIALVDEDGTHAAAGAHAVTVNEATPTVVLEAGGNATVNEGDTFTRIVTFSDGEDNGAAGWTYSIDYGDGSAPVTGTTTEQSLALSHRYLDGAASHTVAVTVTDVAGESATDSFVVTVSNVAPTSALTGADTVAEGSVYALALGALVDPGTDAAASYALDWGDGSAQTYTAAELAALGGLATHTYADGGLGGTPRTITLSVTDEDGTFTAGTKSVTVTNVAPAVALDGAATTAEGSAYTLALAGSDPAGANDALSYVIDWGDGTGPQTVTAAQLAAVNGNVTHVFADDEDGPINATARTISVTVSDEDGGFSTSTHGVTVTNVAPTLAVSGAAAATAGLAYVLSLGAVADPGTDTVTQYVVDWGDGSAPQTITAAELASAGGNVAHTYSAAGDFAISVALVDEDGTHEDAGAHAITVDEPTPTLLLEAGGNATVNEGDTFTRIVTFTDGEDNGAAGWTYSIDYGDGSAPVTGTTTEQSLALSHQYLDGAVSHSVTVTVTDVAGESATDSFAVDVNNVAPIVALDGAATTAEGSVYTLALAGSDPAGANDTLSYVIDWGDGTAPQTVTAAQLAEANGNVTHVFADDEDGPVNETARTISVTVADEDGGSSTTTRNVTVTNVAPTLAVSGAAAATAGVAYVLSLGAVADPGIDTVTQYVVDWGDGSEPQTVTAAELAATGGNVAHTYSATGDFAIGIALVDEDGTHANAGAHAVTVAAAAAPVTIEAGADATVAEGQAFTRTVVFADGADDGAAGWTYAIDYGDGSPVQTGATTSHSIDLDHVYADGAAAHTVTVTVTDVQGESASDSFDVTVTNVAPTVPVTGAATVTAGTTFLLSLGAVADPGDDTVSEYVIDWGDGSAPQTVTAAALAAQGGTVAHVFFAAAGEYEIGVDLVDEDGTHTDAGTHAVTVTAPVLGDAPSRLTSAEPNAWVDAWTHEAVTITHKADVTSATEEWSDVTLTAANVGVLAGGDLSGGDLGVSGQSLSTSATKQELDGREALRFDLDRDATEVTFDFARFFSNDEGLAHNEAARIQLLNDEGLVVAETAVVANSAAGNQTVAVQHEAGFRSVVVTAGAYDANDEFVFGGYADAAGNLSAPPHMSGGKLRGSDFLIDSMGFDFAPAEPIGVAQGHDADGT